MMSSSQKTINKERLKQILAKVRHNSPKLKSDIEHTEYNWHKPRHFSVEQLAALKVFSEKIGEYIQADFTNLSMGEFYASPISVTEHFSYTLEKDFYNSDQNYYLTFMGQGQKQHGFISIPKKSSVGMVEFMLCEENPQGNEERTISSLEERLLLDAAETILGAFNKTSLARGGNSFNSTKSFVRGNWPLDLDNLEELCRIDFKVETGSFSGEISLIVISETLEPALKIALDPSNLINQETIKTALIDNLLNVPVNITARISQDMLSLEEITSLKPGDVI